MLRNHWQKWLLSFVLDQTHSVVIGTEVSPTLAAIIGFLQGTVLSPSCFNVSTNSIAVNEQLSKLFKFADDWNKLRVIRSMADFRLYQDGVNEIFQKAKEKGLLLNPEKCVEMRFDFTKGKKFAKEFPALCVNGTEIQQLTSTKILGTILSADGKWGKQVSKICKTGNIKVRDLYRLLRSGVPESVTEKYVETSLYPALTYGSPVFFNALLEKEKAELRKLDSRIARATRKQRASFEERCLKQCRTQLEKMKSQGNEIIPAPREVKYNLRKQTKSVPFARTERFKRSFVPAMLSSD